ncbi:bifunctional diaminohydroxyphosphoribosylaminopyrimidine deaminase/5-amino-6-(5-phosphoribosylamino)uracil reductase RibD [[Clostridium] polysaccharolyticum]|uniref:Riboflavin biosynthesis protein RibD n=1 Tax=[Clostridium] polysaccharolyticum TaxID=29364 RepID=A0A1H9ZQH6_9FIRM|nr:bifunctional diaminohydroxyphosphoribosylaminopyrimidine deaminase/5-amino-6-(5-phosphoribosylamino)uracil reductase RibD [[Clostridium] polysaccharolyticum]SES83467.1 diaminohydroxyphosphoribosylaminopyrimidine deaminase / 5-amino-6-(5-phosphoribosylamino)uracil reductase [[Clostridium] polysaccharolyticum]
MTDTDYMQLALELARKGMGKTAPNPMVGAVITKQDKIIGLGYHKQYGAPHAERDAFASLSEPAEGATLYVTLEPCCHYGKTPPCTDAIIEHKIKRVVIATLDPNPLVSGKGIQILKEHGISVTTGVLEAEALELNHVFFHYITSGLPYVVMKYAMSADGKIATRTGASQWITSEEARNHVHTLRNQYTGIMVGIGTVKADDPLLTCRIPNGNHPVRIVCDTNCQIALDSNIIKTAKDIPTYIAYHTCPSEKRQALEQAGAILIQIPLEQKHIDLSCLLKELGSLGIDSILAEGGGILNESLLKTGLVNALKVYVAPKIIGGATSRTPVEGCGVDTLNQAYPFTHTSTQKLGTDILLEYIAQKR